MNRLERLINLAAALSDTSQPLMFEAIREQVPGYSPGDPGRRSFERDKDDLRSLGFDITMVELGPNEFGYRMSPEDWTMGPLDLEADEAAALLVAASIARLEGESEGAGLRAALGSGPSGEAGGGFAAHLGVGGPLHGLLADAVARRRPLGFSYRSAEGGVEDRDVQPYGLVMRNGRWYLVGLDTGRDAVRNFRLDRIVGLPTAGRPGSFDVDDGFDPGDAVPSGVGAMGDGAVVARLRLDAAVAWWARRQMGPHRVVDAEADGSVLIEAETDLPAAFVGFVASLVDQGEIIGPPDLRAGLVAHMDAIAAGPRA